jgi:hypothetical protein
MKVFNKEFPVKVKFKKAIFEDSFIEEGMIAYLTGVDIEDKYTDPEDTVYEVRFNQEHFMRHNELLLTDCYWPNKYTKKLNLEKELYTAKEASMFDVRWRDYVDVFKNQTLEEVLSEFVEVIED